METVLIILQALMSLVLIAVIMLQSGKEAGLSGALAGNSDSYLGKSGGAVIPTVPAPEVPIPLHRCRCQYRISVLPRWCR